MDVLTYELSRKYTEEKVSVIIEYIGTGILYQGSVATEADLPSPAEDNKGHMYTVLTDKSEHLSDGKQWINLGDTNIFKDVTELPVTNISDQHIYRLQTGVDYSYHIYKAGTWIELQNKLISGETIKTINGQSILGSGNITISGGSTIDDDTIATTSTWSSSKINTELNKKVNNDDLAAVAKSGKLEDLDQTDTIILDCNQWF